MTFGELLGALENLRIFPVKISRTLHLFCPNKTEAYATVLLSSNFFQISIRPEIYPSQNWLNPQVGKTFGSLDLHTPPLFQICAFIFIHWSSSEAHIPWHFSVLLLFFVVAAKDPSRGHFELAK